MTSWRKTQLNAGVAVVVVVVWRSTGDLVYCGEDVAAILLLLLLLVSLLSGGEATIAGRDMMMKGTDGLSRGHAGVVQMWAPCRL